MKTINQIQFEISAVQAIINELQKEVTAMESTEVASEEDKYVFTASEMYEFVRLIALHCEEGAKMMIENADVDIEDHVKIEWNTNGATAEVELDIDSASIVEELASQVEFDTEVDYCKDMAETAYAEIVSSRNQK